MKIPFFNEFVSQANNTVEQVSRYITIDLNRNFKELVNVLNNLTFEDNFQSFSFTGTIAANSELPIRNKFRGGITPTKRIIVRGDTYSPYIVDGDTPWNQNFLYLKNTHASQPATATVIFLR